MAKITFNNCYIQIGMQNCSVNKGAQVNVNFPDKINEKPKVQIGQVIDEAIMVNSEYTDLPAETHYADAARWVRKMKDTRDFIRESNNNMEELARILTPIFGWVVEGHQLKKALYRN